MTTPSLPQTLCDPEPRNTPEPFVSFFHSLGLVQSGRMGQLVPVAATVFGTTSRQQRAVSQDLL